MNITTVPYIGNNQAIRTAGYVLMQIEGSQTLSKERSGDFLVTASVTVQSINEGNYSHTHAQ